MQTLSAIFKDRPMPVTKSAVWWTEFVLRHDNIVDYLRPPNVGQAWWVKRQIDVWIFAVVLVLTLITLLLYVNYLLLKKLLFLFLKNGTKNSRTKEKKN